MTPASRLPCSFDPPTAPRNHPPVRFSKHFAREVAARRPPREHRARAATFQSTTWPLQRPEEDADSSVWADNRSYGARHPEHRLRQPSNRRVLSKDCLCPSSAFRRARPPPSAFRITAPGYDCRYQVLGVLATGRERADSPDYPWATEEVGKSRQKIVSDSKCAKWILNNL